MSKHSAGSRWLIALALGLAILFPLVVRDDYVLHLAIFSGISILLALSQDVVTGVAGQISVAQAAFFGVGAYTASLLTLRGGLSFWTATPIAMACAGILSMLLGAVSFRLKGVSLGVTTLAFGELTYLVFLNWTAVTRGPMGLTGIKLPSPLRLGSVTLLSFATKTDYYWLVLGLVVFVTWAVVNLVKSRWGRGLRALRLNEVAAQSMGVNTNRCKLMAFMVSEMIAGLAGSCYAHYVQFVSPDTFVFSYAITILTMAVIGGLGTIWGPMIGAVIVTVLPEYLRVIRDYRLIMFGACVLIMMARFPQGLLPGLRLLVFRGSVWWANRTEGAVRKA
jgi:branched-chain amino acid transport system permease protein